MVLDNRAKKLAKILIDYSLKINSSDVFLIQAEDNFKEFAEYLAESAKKKGAKIIHEYFNLGKRKAMIDRNNHTELKQEGKRLSEIAEKATASVRLDASTNPYYLKSVNPKKIADHMKIARKPFGDRIVGDGKKWKGKKWNVLGFPCIAEAKKAGMTFSEYKNFVYGATNIDWSKTTKKMQKIKKAFDNAKDVHIIVPGQTDFHISLKGRGAKICNGGVNMPDGEVYYGPVENSAEGHIYFQYDSARDGNIVSGIRLEYKKGKIVNFSAKKNQEFLASMIKLKGVDRLGELGIGCNYGIKKYTKNLLFDEKIGGTIHLALGDSYKQDLMAGGGKNYGEIHWDLVCDLRKINGLPGGEIYVDGKLVQRHGKWKF